MSSLRVAAAAAGLFAVLPTALAGFDASSSSNIAVYWGQNSYGQSSGPDVQERLSYYCDNADIDIIALAFLDGLTSPLDANFANAGDNCTTFSSGLLDCPQIEDDIATCQSAGKTIILSLGGATYSGGGWSSDSDAQSSAQLIWETFGPVQSGSNADRPFGNSVVDGFDFDFESSVTNLLAFATELRSLMDAASDKSYYLSAAPQCPYPDAADTGALDGGVPFDFVMVQFYNNYCGVNSYVSGSTTQNNFNFDTWDTWAKGSGNPDVKVLMGIPANTGAGGGYTDGSALAGAISYSETFSSFGGIMMWDMSQLYANSGFLDEVVSDLS